MHSDRRTAKSWQNDVIICSSGFLGSQFIFVEFLARKSSMRSHFVCTGSPRCFHLSLEFIFSGFMSMH